MLVLIYSGNGDGGGGTGAWGWPMTGGLTVCTVGFVAASIVATTMVNKVAIYWFSSLPCLPV